MHTQFTVVIIGILDRCLWYDKHRNYLIVNCDHHHIFSWIMPDKNLCEYSLEQRIEASLL